MGSKVSSYSEARGLYLLRNFSLKITWCCAVFLDPAYLVLPVCYFVFVYFVAQL